MINIYKSITLPLSALLAVIIAFAAMPATAQQTPADESLQYLALGIRQFEAGEYDAAQQSFKTVLDNVQVLPTEICYFFGATSYELGKYKQSINWLNKYLELKGTTGQYYEACIDYLQRSEAAYRALAENTPAIDNAPDDDMLMDVANKVQVECDADTRVLCPACSGSTVIINRGKFGLEYKTCPFSDEHGTLSCDEYNALIRGEMTPKK
jgi:tetratricopeptide (TPR) repeat protein